MLATAGAFLRRQSQEPAVMLFFAGLFLVSQLSILAVLEKVGFADALALQLTLDAGTFAERAAAIFARGAAEAYIAHYYYDFLHPLWYATTLALALGFLVERAALPARLNACLLLPFLAGIGDEIENGLHLYMMLDTANITPVLVGLANGAALLKWAVIGLCLSAALLLGGRVLAGGRRAG